MRWTRLPRLMLAVLVGLGLTAGTLTVAQPERAAAAGWVGGGGPVGPPPGI